MLKFHEIRNRVIAEVEDQGFRISTPQEVLDIIGDSVPENCNRIIVHENNLHPDFFKLHTGLAGDILQKFSNYNFKLAVIGDFSKYKSKNLQDFIRESNRGNRVFFVESFDDAVNKLAAKQVIKS